MLQGFWKLTWVETKIFVREPMGVIGTFAVPLGLFLLLGRKVGGNLTTPGSRGLAPFSVPILAALLIAVSAVLSLVAIVSIYREGGILKRLRATPLSPLTILGAHVFVKLAFSVATLALLVVAGRQMFPNNVIPKSRFHPIFQKLYEGIPLPNQVAITDPNNLGGNYFGSGVLKLDRNNYDFKMNYQATQNLMIWSSCSRMDAPVTGGYVFGDKGGPALGSHGFGDTTTQLPRVG